MTIFVPLQFKSQDWYWNAYFEGPIELDKYSETFWQFSINVVLADPYKYAVEGTKNTAISDQVSVVSAGATDSPIIVQATALKNASYFSITKNDEDYFMIGDDDLDKKSKIIHRLYLMMRCVLSLDGLKSLTVLSTIM